MLNLSQTEYLQLSDLTKQWLHNYDADKALLIQEQIGNILNVSSDKSLYELNRNYPEIYEEITRFNKENLARVFPCSFPNYVK